MLKRGMFVLFALLVVVALFGFAYAEEAEAGRESIDVVGDMEDAGGEQLEGAGEEYPDAQLEKSAGITPDSSFYFVEENILSKFRGDLENREKMIAEIKAMVQEGNIEDARKSLERYNRYADELEKESDPEKRDEARRSAVAIKNVLREIESEIPEEDREEFVNSIIEKEKKIVTAVEIAGKIKDLCEQLSGLDPLEYSRVCRLEGDGPDWQKKLDKKLTAEQREEAKKFGEIMSECFRTAGQECRCEDIPFPDFAATCSIAAPLATACEIKGDEKACEEMDNLEMPELPPHLQDIMDELENNIGDDRFDLHMPKECEEAGATDRESCFKVMFKLNAPEECVEALDKGEIIVSNEREAREKCEEVMFRENAPEECVEAGLKDHKECGKLMFKEKAPQECVDAGITGENRNDPKKCEELMREFGDKERGEGFEHGGFGGNCRDVQNAEERLKCYDGATQGVKNFDERFRQTKEKEKQCAESCLSSGKAWDFSGGMCTCREGEEREYNFDQKREKFRMPSECQGLSPEECGAKYYGQGPRPYPENRPNIDCAVMSCQPGYSCVQGRGCVPDNNYNEPIYGDKDYVDKTAKYDCSKLDCGPSPNYCDPWGGCIKGEGGHNPDGSSCDEGYEWSGSGCIPFGTGDYGFDDSSGETTSPPPEPTPTPSPEPAPAPSSEPTPESSGITGGVIQIDNRFTDYFFGK